MRVLLTTLNTKYVHTNIALKYLYKSVENIGVDLLLKEYTINEPIGNTLRDIASVDADVIAFSVYIWNVEDILKLAENIKKIKPQVKIILGGPEVTYRSKEIIERYSFIDYVIVGEGEETFPKLIEYLNDNGTNDSLPNHISYRNGNEIIVGNIGIVCDINNIPRIAQSIADEYDGKIVYIETVRGCPYNCSYCLSSTIKGIRPFDMERAKSELLILINAKVKLIKFVDRTFNYDKKRAMELWKFLLENNICSEFHFEISAHLIDDEMLEFLKSVPKGVFRLEIGVQSTNADTIKAINRSTDFDVISKVVRELMSVGNVTTHLDLIAGLPYEGYVRFKESFNDVYNLKPTELQLGFLKMLSGCQITSEKEKYGFEYTSYPPYEVIKNDFITFEELTKLKFVEEVLNIYYNSMRYKNSLERVISKYQTPYDFYFAISRYALDNGYFERKISAEEWMDVLFRFYQYNGFEDVEDFKIELQKDHTDDFGNKRRRGLMMYT